MPPLRDNPGSGTGDTAGRQLSTTEFISELGALIAELEQARGGNQSLDVRIRYGFRLSDQGEDMASLLIKEGVSWPTVQAALNEIIPPYSTSLDAALRGEEIVFTLRSSKGGRWGAMQRTSSGGEQLAWAATEPLARRLAALKCREADLRKFLEDHADISGKGEGDGSTTPYGDRSGGDVSATGNGKSAPTGIIRQQENPERAQYDLPSQADQVEKDWEILF